MRIVERRSEDLAARDILEGRRDAALRQHFVLLHRTGNGEARLGGAPGAQHQDGLREFAAGLGQSERGQFLVIERGFAHHAVDEIGHG